MMNFFNPNKSLFTILIGSLYLVIDSIVNDIKWRIKKIRYK